MSIIIKKLESLNVLTFWDKKGIRFYPKNEFEMDCDKALSENGLNAIWWFDGETGKIVFDYAKDFNGNDVIFDDAKEILKVVIRKWVAK